MTSITDVSQDSEMKRTSGSDSREYIVFAEISPGVFEVVGHFDATNAEAAIKEVEPTSTHRYAACPVRNWSVGKPIVKTITQVSIEFE